jgi:hypothetical protein
MDTGPASPGKHRYHTMAFVLFAVGCILLVLAFLIGISDNPPGIASMLVGFFAVVLAIIFGVTKSGGRKPAHQLLYWAPRALCIVFALFISLFALDVFEEGRGFWDTTLALLMHLIPTFLLLAVLAVSWRREWIAGIFFPLLGVLYVVWAWNRPFGSWSLFLLMAGPLVLTGALFLLNWHYGSELKGRP